LVEWDIGKKGQSWYKAYTNLKKRENITKSDMKWIPENLHRLDKYDCRYNGNLTGGFQI
jgi:hypothetical protein